MIEINVVKIGLALHLLCQLYNAYKFKTFRVSTKVLIHSLVLFFTNGILLTICKSNFDKSIRSCGTEVFNPLIIISIYGNVLNFAVLTFSYLILRIAYLFTNLKK